MTVSDRSGGSGTASDAARVGGRIRFMRRQRKITLEQLAGSSGLTKSYLSKVERGLSVPSISAALKVADGFGISIGELVGVEEGNESINVVRKHERQSFMKKGAESGYNYELLSGGKRFKTMEPLIMHPPFEFESHRFFEHVGEELIFVLSGKVEVEFPDQYVVLKPGDSIHFDSHLLHRSRSIGKKRAELLVVVTGENASVTGK